MELYCQEFVYTPVVIKFLQKILICLLVLAIPAQGYAVVGMLACTSDRSLVLETFPAPTFSVKSAVRHDHASHQHEGKNAAGAVHHGVVVASLLDEGVGGDFAADGQFYSNCSVCASCCTGAALMQELALPAAAVFSSKPLPATSTVLLSFVIDGLLRPPRNSLA